MSKRENHISSLTVRGYKSLAAEQRVDIKPLTILAGANSSGKSSLMQPLLLLKQTLESVGDPGAIQLDGEHVRFTSAEQLLSVCQGEQNEPRFSITIELKSSESLTLEYCKHRTRGFDVVRMTYVSKVGRIEARRGMTHEEITAVLPASWSVFHEQILSHIYRDFRWSVFRERCFLEFRLTHKEHDGNIVRFVPPDASPANLFVPYIRGVVHLQGLRGNPKRTYPKAAVGQYFQGAFESYVASVISAWQDQKDDNLRRLGIALESMGLTWKVQADPLDDTQIQLKVGRLPRARRGGAHDMVSIADVGFGVSQALPVVVALIAAQPGQLVYLEQPEIHLHPLAQRRLAKLFVDAVERGVVVVAETHSALLLREVQTLIAKGDISHEEVALHWFMRDSTGCTSIRTADLDNEGAYGDWPTDFDQTELDAEMEYLNLVETRKTR